MRRILTVLFIATATLYFTFLIVSGQTAPDTSVIQPAQLILTADNSQGILNREAQFVYGPFSCTSYGDPFSPFNTVFTDERPYSYKYRIVIPSDYPDDVLRIELFDPDSINQNITETAVSYTNLAIANGFSATPEKLTCPNPAEQSQSHACIIKTNEDSLIPAVPGVELEEVNHVWLVRVDENRGGNQAGTCGPILDPYNPTYNTRLLFQLFYNRQNNDGTMEEVPLARYTGQVGDGSLDSGDHETDLRWVSPGGAQSPDQSAFVPVDPSTPINPATGQPYTFELNLERDLPNIVVDPITGDKIVYLQVIALPPGASKNTFALWAGPNDNVAAIPGNVNSRNLHILNNPGSHNAHGVKILATEALPMQTLSDQGLDIPLIHFGPEYAGKTVYLSTFDLDTGTLPPINFYLDTLAYTPDDSADGFDETKTDWAVAHGYEGDPDGGCFTNPYNEECDSTWITYAITLPSDLECAGSSIDECTPFYGGQFMARIQGGSEDELEYDAFTWQIRSSGMLPEWDNTQGCSAFPIGVGWDNHSVLPPGQTGANAWRDDFDYPNPGPDYYQYINHVPNTPLEDAKPGYLYYINSSILTPAFLAWNVCGAASSDLTNSLTWPGNAKDYTPGLGTCPANGLPVFPGFMELGDPTDLEMNIDDWVAVSTGLLTSSSTHNVLKEHIDLNRTLRLLVWEEMTGTGSDAGIRIKRFGLFRIVGYTLSQATGSAMIMVEFVGWDDSCGQLVEPVPLTSVTIQPQPEIVGNEVAVTAVSTPTNATQPISYTWQTASKILTHTNGLTDTASFTFPYSSTQTITVTASNGVSFPVTDTIEVTIEPLQLFLPLIISASDGQEASAPQNLENWYNYIAYWNPLARINSRRS